jgi:hypothetical protein
MLYPQIPRTFSRKFKASIEVKAGPVKTKLENSKDGGSDFDFRFEAVRRYIETHYDLGTVEFPGEWVKDSFDVRYISVRDEPDLFLLTGCVRPGSISPPGLNLLISTPSHTSSESANTYFALGGSAVHKIGTAQSKQVNIGYSYLPHLVKSLLTYTESTELQAKMDYSCYSRLEDDDLAGTIYQLWNRSSGMSFKVDFLARKVFYGKTSIGENCLLMTPLYVALE